jgi:hypothetical protein
MDIAGDEQCICMMSHERYMVTSNAALPCTAVTLTILVQRPDKKRDVTCDRLYSVSYLQDRNPGYLLAVVTHDTYTSSLKINKPLQTLTSNVSAA